LRASESSITAIEAWALSFALPHPLRLGDMYIDRRHYALVRITTAGGAEGLAYGLTRGAPVDLVVAELLAPLLIGEDALDIPRLVERCSRATVPLGTFGLVLRGLSLLDIALWDIKAKLAGMPLWRLLGGARSEVPVMVVEGYPLPDETPEGFAQRVSARAAEGYTAVKIANAPDPAVVAQRLKAVRAAVGPETALVVDVAWAWRDLRSAVAVAEIWEPYRLEWIEDPFPSQQVRTLARLRDAVRTPIAAGDEVSLRSTVEQILAERAVDVLRLDVTTIGGVTGFAEVRAQAAAGGYQISTHVYPEIHSHLAFAWPGIEPIERFPAGSPFDFVDRFIGTSLDSSAAGTMRAPEAPGLGLEVDWKVVEGAATRHSRVQAQGS
jgi:L-alanine-DL-glutamate epimerase-like enolase superfamily enzyme